MASSTTKVWHTAAYIRLSREDVATRNGERAESESVVNQQQIIGDFIASQPDLGSHLTFVDDGATGTNFDRAGFQGMMLSCKLESPAPGSLFYPKSAA